MAQFAAFWTKIASLISTIRIPDIVDILLVAYLIYKLIMLIRKTNSYRVARGLLMILIALWLSGVLKLTMINYLLEKMVELGLIALVILFQPELRRLLERMGGNISSLFGSKRLDHLTTETEITQTIMACSDMSTTHTGALIVFERANALDEQMRSGTIVNADVSAELLKNIFFVKAPLHDGAVIIQNGRIAAAGCVLPLTANTNLSPDLGTRHRAGIGMSEHSDAVVVIVSEETGSISVAVDGMLKRRLTPETFEAILRSELIPEEGRQQKRWEFLSRLKLSRRENHDDKEERNDQQNT